MTIEPNIHQHSKQQASDYGLFNKPKITTKEFAEALSLKQQSIRAALCRAGHYLGLKPVSLPNGRLLWDAIDVTLLMKGNPT